MLLSFLLIFATLTRSYQQETRSESQVLTGRGAEGLSRIPHLGLAGLAASEAVRGARAATKVPGKKGSGARYRIRLAAISGKRNADVSVRAIRGKSDSRSCLFDLGDTTLGGGASVTTLDGSLLWWRCNLRDAMMSE